MIDLAFVKCSDLEDQPLNHDVDGFRDTFRSCCFVLYLYGISSSLFDNVIYSPKISELVSRKGFLGVNGVHIRSLATNRTLIGSQPCL